MSALVKGQERYVCFVAEDSQGYVVGWLLTVVDKHIFNHQLTASNMNYYIFKKSYYK